ncbi:MAG: SDR family oxidoreductase [Pseudomonadota bacterium]
MKNPQADAGLRDMRVLYIGGSGEISTSCVSASIACGHEVTVFNRGNSNTQLPDGVVHVAGDLSGRAPYAPLADQHFDVVCQFLAFTPETIERDVDFFAQRCGQYIFISTASAYQKSAGGVPIDESTPLDNPFMAYSRAKAACERLLQDAPITATIVRPSHTYRARLPSTVIDGNHLAWRLAQGKPVVVHDDGTSLWTLTHADDFARAFVQLHGNTAAFNEHFHITSDEAYSWNEILAEGAAALGFKLDLRCVDSHTLIANIPDLEGSLLGDKANSLVFNNSKIRAATNGWRCQVALSDGIARAAEFALQRLSAGYSPDQQLDTIIDHLLEAGA